MKVSEMNSHQRKAFYNIYHAANWLVGGLENTLLDNEKNSPEYINAYKSLHDHESLVDTLYTMATTEIYNDGFCCFNTSTVTRVLRDINFCGKDWIIERCRKRLKKMGY